MPDMNIKNQNAKSKDLEDIETRPYPNEHACRLREPGDFKKDSIRSAEREHNGKKYRVLMGKLKNPPKGKEGSMVEQAYRYNKKNWTASEAKSHCKDHDGKFEAAKDSKSENPDMERRILAFDNTELRLSDDEKPKIVGYAAKYGIFTNILWFREKIRAGAFDDVLDNDIRCLKNHDPNLILGRTTNETLRLNSNTVGLHFEDDIPDTTTGRDTREEIRRGDISGCSFSFIVAEDEWKYFDDERPAERTIVKIKQLFDVGPVTYPAYPDTTVAARSLEKAKKEKSDMSDQSDLLDDRADKKYECECIECGHTLKTDKHCKDMKCPECGGQMRRKERPGPGQKSDDGNQEINETEGTASEAQTTNEELTFEQQQDINRKYRKAERIMNRNLQRIEELKQAEA